MSIPIGADVRPGEADRSCATGHIRIYWHTAPQCPLCAEKQRLKQSLRDVDRLGLAGPR